MPIQKFGDVYKRVDSPFLWIWYYNAANKRKCESTQTQDRALAMKILRSRITEFSELRSGVKEVSDMPYSDFGELYLKHCKARFTQETIRSYNTHIKVFQRFLASEGLSRLSDIDKALMDRFITDRRCKGNKANTCNSYLKNLHAQFEFAKEQRLISENPLPAKYEKVPVTDAKEKKALSKEEYQRIMAVIKKRYPFYYPIFYVYFHTGLRFTELIKQEWKDTFLDEGFMRVTKPKGKKRTENDAISLHSGVIEVIRKLKGRHAQFVFVNERKELFSQRTRKFIRRLQKVANELEIKDVNLHTTRHTFGSQLIDSGATLAEVQSALRHSDVRATQAYIHSFKPSVNRAIDRLRRRLRI